ncbi:MAG: ArsR family transcriptional regulator [Fluviicola sp.]|jgi:predicted transcriptional regulator
MSFTRKDDWSKEETKSALIGKALASEVRIRILKILKEKPGLNSTEISKLLKRHRTTIDDHLFFLKEANLIKEEYIVHQLLLSINTKNNKVIDMFV